MMHASGGDGHLPHDQEEPVMYTEKTRELLAELTIINKTAQDLMTLPGSSDPMLNATLITLVKAVEVARENAKLAVYASENYEG
jgi:hypothetical protein